MKNFIYFFRYTLCIGPFFALSFVAITIGLLTFVASELFKLFINIKDENDKTI